MGRGDNRLSLKMKRKKAQRKKAELLKKKMENSQKKSAK